MTVLVAQIIIVILCFICIPTVVSNYIYSDSPISGFMIDEKSSVGLQNRQSSRYDFFRYFKDRNGQTLDALFKKKKPLNQQPYVVPVEPKKTAELKNSEPGYQDRPDSMKPGNMSVVSSRQSKPDLQKPVKLALLPVQIVFKDSGKSNRRSKPSFQLNENLTFHANNIHIRRTSVQSEPQKIRMKNNRHLSALSISPGHLKMPTYALVDETIKNSPILDKNMQALHMSRVLDDIIFTMAGKSKKIKRKVSSDSVKKYFNKNDNIYTSHTNRKQRMAEVGKSVANFDNMFNKNLAQSLFTHGINPKLINDAKNYNKVKMSPYALFYSTSPDLMVEKDLGFVPILNTGYPKKHTRSNKKKRLTIFYDHDGKNHPHEKSPIMGTNAVKLHKNCRKMTCHNG